MTTALSNVRGPDKACAKRWLPLLLSCLVLGCAAFAAEGRQGVLEPRQRATLAAELAMPVASVPFRVGDSFRAGDILAAFDSEPCRAALAAAEAAARVARAALDGIRLMAESKQASTLEVVAAESDFVLAQSKLTLARRDLAACEVRAPFDGRVAEVFLQDYEWAGKGAAILAIIDDTVLQVRFLLPETDFHRVRAGDRLALFVPALAAEDAATVTRVGAVFDAASRTFDVWADLDNAAGRYRAGMTALVAWPD